MKLIELESTPDPLSQFKPNIDLRRKEFFNTWKILNYFLTESSIFPNVCKRVVDGICVQSAPPR